MTTSVRKNLVFRSFFEKQKLTGPNFIDWYRQLRLVLSTKDKEKYPEQPILAAPVTAAPDQPIPPTALTTYNEWVKNQKEIAVIMLLTMDLEIQRNLAYLGANDMLTELKALYSKQAEQELFQTMREFHMCKQEEGQSVSFYVLKIKSYIDQLERLGHPVTLNLGVSLILVGLSKEYDSFVQNYNMHSLGKTVNELHAMLKLHEKTLPKKVAAPPLHAIRAGKPSYAPKSKNPPPPKKDNPAKDAICHHCGEVGHWRRNCPTYLIELLKKKQLSQGASTSGCGTHICNTTQGLQESKKLNPGALSLYIGNGQRAAVEAIGNYHLCLLGGLVIVLNNCHYAPSITRGIISVSRLYEDGFINRFELNNAISVSKNNVVYFSAILRDGVYAIEMSCSNTNDISMYVVSNKRAKLNLNSSLLWHCRLGHDSKKRIEKLKHDRLLNSTNIESLGKCVSCMSGKMARKPYSHQVKRAKDLLGLIHTDVCGPFRIMSRQGANYFVTFTDDFSQYGYVYLLKHKHEVFETFKVFQKEVENQLRKTIKSLCSDRGGEYTSQEFLNHLKEHGIIAYRTPPYTPQHNGVSERRNRTLLDMVRSMMSQTTLPKSFWDYALESAAHILNRVPAKKVDKTPYEIWYGQAPKAKTVDIRAIRILIAIAAFYDYEIWQMDVKTAFLNGHLSEEVYMTQPEGFVNPKYPNHVCKLKRSIYGLKQASRQWNKRFDDEIKKFGFTQNRDEPCVYQKASGSYVTFLILYVDDILIMGNNIPMLQDVKSYLGKCFAMKDLGEAAYILGIKIYRDRSKRLIGLCQSAYIEKILKRYYMENSKRGTIPMQEKLKLSKSDGASTPVAHEQRSIRFGCWFNHNPGELHWTIVKNILKYLRNTKDMFLTGYVFILNGGDIDWKSTKQSISATSSTDAEYIDVFDASKEAVWIRKFIYGLNVVPTIEELITMYCDNTRAIAIANHHGVTKDA
ncbi:retrotransposon protein, putative, ty1-copia subclass [Tanacetum coccineum]|uniref:Retrotransposon protein, putative, ty1-copia subclass n=1 Tax=Tanacetum coccineum TaxID=301880 RepID=A0ABQ5D5A4_9ASTR